MIRMNNIILIGMPGVGKSTIGVLLAKSIGYNFIDSDILIQAFKGKKLIDIIQEEGLDNFLKLEDYVNSTLEVVNTVVSTGGSVVYSDNAMNYLKSIGTVIYLKQDYEILKQRIDNINTRGIIIKENQSFKDLYNERIPLYEKYADIVIDEKNNSIE